MKKVNALITLLLGILLMTFTQPHQVSANSNVQVTIQHVVNQESARGQPAQPGAFAHFSIYDLTAVAHDWSKSGGSVSTLAEKLGRKDDQAIEAYIKANRLRQVAQVQTNGGGLAHFTVDGTWGNAYLIVQTSPGYDPTNALNVYEKSMPIVMSLPLENQAQGVTINTKAVRVQRAVYFYKYGRSGRETAPLKDAVFAVRHNGDYLTTSNQWLSTTTPLTDRRVLKMHSAADGLVLLKDVRLGAGSYVVQELKAPKGYELTRQAQNVALEIPRADTEAQITVNGAALRPLLADQIQPGESSRRVLRVYNPAKPPIPGRVTPPGPPQGHHGPRPKPNRHLGLLPKLGEAKTSLVILGIIFIAIAVMIEEYVHKIGEREIDEK